MCIQGVTMQRTRLISTFLFAAMAAFPIGSAWGTAHAAGASAALRAQATTVRKIKGPVVTMRWGPVQAIVTVKGKTITKVKISTTAHSFRSQYIDQQAVPLLRQE